MMKMMPALPYILALVAGLVCGYYCASMSPLLLLVAMVFFVALGCGLRNIPKYRTVPFITSFAIVGMLFMIHARNGNRPLPEHDVDIVAVVTDTPKQTKKGYTCDMYVVDGVLRGSTIRASIQSETPLVLGKTYSFNTKLRQFRNFANSGNFNYRRWAEGKGYAASVFVRADDFIDKMPAMADENPLQQLPISVRIPLKAKLLRERVLKMFSDEGVREQQYAIMAAMAFGDKSAIDNETREVYAKTGASHLLALSGMHLGILFVLLSMLFIRGRRGILGRTIVIATIWLYVVLVGMPSSVVRAATMLTIYTIVTMDGRNKMSINALCITAMLMLLVHPMSVWDTGFQLSFMAMLSIFVFFTPIYNIIGDQYLFRHPIQRKLWSMISVSTAAQIGTAPLTMYYFGRFSTCFLLTNLVAIPLVMVLLYAVFIGVVFAFLPFVKSLCVWMVSKTTMLLSGFLMHLSAWSGVSIENISINWIQLMLIYAMIVVLTLLVHRFVTRC